MVSIYEPKWPSGVTNMTCLSVWRTFSAWTLISGWSFTAPMGFTKQNVLAFEASIGVFKFPFKIFLCQSFVLQLYKVLPLVFVPLPLSLLHQCQTSAAFLPWQEVILHYIANADNIAETAWVLLQELQRTLAEEGSTFAQINPWGQACYKVGMFCSPSQYFVRRQFDLSCFERKHSCGRSPSTSSDALPFNKPLQVPLSCGQCEQIEGSLQDFVVIVIYIYI